MKDQNSWAVSVERNGEQVVTLSSNGMCGRDLTADDEETIRRAAAHLLSFVGAPPRQDVIELPEKHPLRVRAEKAEAQCHILRTALVGLVGVDTRAELEDMEATLRLAPAPAEDKAAAIDGIHALLSMTPNGTPTRDAVDPPAQPAHPPVYARLEIVVVLSVRPSPSAATRPATAD